MKYLGDLDGRKCLKCGSSTTYVTKKTGAKRWSKYKNGWECYKCHLREYMKGVYQKKKTVEFHNVFEANKAAVMFRWVRNHDHGRVRFTISLYRYNKLRKAGIGFWVVDDKKGNP